MQYPDEVTRLRASGVDEYGNPNRSWDAPAELVLDAFVTYNVTVYRDGVVSAPSAYMPPGVDVDAGDRLVVEAVTYNVQGVKRIRSPSREVMTVVYLEPLAGD